MQKVLDRLADTSQPPGQVILLHDAGGDRSQTVAALPKLIDALRAKGLTLVTVDDLAGMTPAQAHAADVAQLGRAMARPRWASRLLHATWTSC